MAMEPSPRPGSTLCSECDAGLDGAIGLVVDELQYLGICCVDRRRLTIGCHIGAFEGRNAYGLEQSRRKLEPEYIRIGSDVISDVIVRAAKPEPSPFSTRIGAGSTVSTARREVA